MNQYVDTNNFINAESFSVSSWFRTSAGGIKMIIGFIHKLFCFFFTIKDGSGYISLGDEDSVRHNQTGESSDAGSTLKVPSRSQVILTAFAGAPSSSTTSHQSLPPSITT